MGFTSEQIERAVTFTRGLGAWAILVGLAVAAFSVVIFPWHRPVLMPGHLHEIMAVQTNDAANASSSRPPSREFIDTYDSRSGPGEMRFAALAYIFPGVLFILFSRVMARFRVWAFVAVMILCAGSVAVYLVECFAMLLPDAPIRPETMVLETLVRPVGLVLLVLCLHALPEAWDQVRRRRQQARGFELIMPGSLTGVGK